MATNKVVLPKKVVDKALNVRCDNEEGKEKIKKILLKLPFAKNGNTSTDFLEEVVKRYEMKYDVHLSYIQRYKNENEKGKMRYFYSGMMKNSKGEWLETAYGISTWEVYAKSLIFLYYYVQEGCKGGRVSSDVKQGKFNS